MPGIVESLDHVRSTERHARVGYNPGIIPVRSGMLSPGDRLGPGPFPGWAEVHCHLEGARPRREPALVPADHATGERALPV